MFTTDYYIEKIFLLGIFLIAVEHIAMLLPVVKNCLVCFFLFSMCFGCSMIVFSASAQIVFQFSTLGRAIDVQ